MQVDGHPWKPSFKALRQSQCITEWIETGSMRTVDGRYDYVCAGRSRFTKAA